MVGLLLTFGLITRIKSFSLARTANLKWTIFIELEVNKKLWEKWWWQHLHITAAHSAAGCECAPQPNAKSPAAIFNSNRCSVTYCTERHRFKSRFHPMVCLFCLKNNSPKTFLTGGIMKCSGILCNMTNSLQVRQEMMTQQQKWRGRPCAHMMMMMSLLCIVYPSKLFCQCWIEPIIAERKTICYLWESIWIR